jgi:hypothetical protein
MVSNKGMRLRAEYEEHTDAVMLTARADRCRPKVGKGKRNWRGEVSEWL